MNVCILINTSCFFLQPSSEGKIVAIPLPFITVTNDQALRDTEIYSKDILVRIGLMATTQKYDFAYSFLNSPDYITEENFNEIARSIYTNLNYRVIAFEEFLNYLWFVKDNSVSGSLALAYAEENIRTLASLQNNRICTMSDGKRRDVYFSRADMETVFKIYDKANDIFPKTTVGEVITPIEYDENNKIKTTIIKADISTKQYSDFNRVQRALSLLSILRSVAFLPYKLSLYIPILESLFSPSDGELTFKVSQRVAFYIGEDMTEKKLIFEQVKRVYEIRSRYLHGQPFEKKSLKLDFAVESKNMDGILRRVLTKVILYDYAVFIGKSIEEYLNNLVFKEDIFWRIVE